MIIRSPVSSASQFNGLNTVCASCLLSKAKPIARSATRHFSQSSKFGASITATRPKLWAGYFSANGLREKGQSRRGALTSAVPESVSFASKDEASLAPSGSPRIPIPTDLPHRRRKAARQAAAAQPSEPYLPPNSSSTLSDTASKAPTNSLRRLLPVLLSLSKPRLSVLVVLTACASYSLYPVPDLLSPSLTETPSLSPLTLLFLTTGTTLCAASANTLNMLYEPKWDALMSRTRNRPLVRGLISPKGALIFAILSGLAGTTALYYGVNPTVSFLGALNIALYAGVYTPLKRVSVINTWVGALVGGIPPLMGWAAAAGQSATEGGWQELLLGERNIGGWLLSVLLIAWQFPHFMSLSWSIREEYKQAGYKMLAWTNPARNARVALRYSLLFFPISIGLCYFGVTEWSFAVTSAPVNVWLCKEAAKFWWYEGQKGSARGLFWASVWHLPVIMILAMVQKKGLWSRIWNAVFGLPEYDEDDEEDGMDMGMEAGMTAPNVRAVPVAVPGRNFREN